MARQEIISLFVGFSRSPFPLGGKYIRHSCSSRWAQAAAMALRMLREDRIHLLGSDCHNMRSRKPNLGEAVRLIEKKLGPGALDRVELYGREILNG